MLHWLTRAYLGHRAAGRGYLGPELRLQLQFAGIFRSCANILHTPESAVRCGPVTSWRLQLQWCNSQQLPASHNCCCPRPELWASTCLAQSVLSGEKCHHMCLQSSLAGGGGGGGGALRPEHTTPLTPAVVRWPRPQPAPAAADRLPQRDSAHRRADRLLPQLQRAGCGPGSRVTLTTLPPWHNCGGIRFQ